MKVRRIGKRVLASGSLLSDEPAFRTLQVRFLGVFITFSLLFVFLAHAKAVRHFGALVYLVELVTVVGGAVLGVRQYQASQKVARHEPQDVELELSAGEVQEQLASGALAPLDLVQQRGTWTTLLESMQFSEAAEPAHQQTQRRARIAMVVMVTGGLLVALGLGLFLLNLGDILMWLARD